MTTDIVDRLLRVLTMYKGVPIRWGKTKKIKDVFIGHLIGASFSHTSRMGGGFNLHIRYGGVNYSNHQDTMKQMQKDYFQCLQVYIDTANGGPLMIDNKRIVIPRTTSRNASTDLELFLPQGDNVNKWVPFGEFMPNSVRMLDTWSAKVGVSMSTGEWVARYSSQIIDIEDLYRNCNVICSPLVRKKRPAAPRRKRPRPVPEKAKDTTYSSPSTPVIFVPPTPPTPPTPPGPISVPTILSKDEAKRRTVLNLPNFRTVPVFLPVPMDVFENGGLKGFMDGLLCNDKTCVLTISIRNK